MNIDGFMPIYIMWGSDPILLPELASPQTNHFYCCSLQRKKWSVSELLPGELKCTPPGWRMAISEAISHLFLSVPEYEISNSECSISYCYYLYYSSAMRPPARSEFHCAQIIQRLSLPPKSLQSITKWVKFCPQLHQCNLTGFSEAAPLNWK